MWLEAINQFVSSNTELVVIGAITLVEVAPIKINPWKAIFKAIGKMINGELESQLLTLKRDFEETKADNMRSSILSFAKSCRNQDEHTEEDWNHIISQIKVYETYVEEKEIDNGVIEETALYLRELYQQRLHKNDFL